MKLWDKMVYVREEPTEGYLVVLRPKPLLERHASPDYARQKSQPLKEIREAFKSYQREQYRGIDRDSLAGNSRKNARSRRKMDI
jgi:hypothetical protein